MKPLPLLLSILQASVAAAALLAAPVAHATEDGDEKCGPDRYILKYDASANRWRETARHCRGDGDSPTVRSRTEDGDEKCGPDHYILKYDLGSRRWRETARKCS